MHPSGDWDAGDVVSSPCSPSGFLHQALGARRGSVSHGTANVLSHVNAGRRPQSQWFIFSRKPKADGVEEDTEFVLSNW